MLNLTLSSVHILRDYSVGKSSLTGLISNTLLLLPRIFGWLRNAWQAYSTNAPVSFFSKKPSLPNTIDADWRYVPSVFKPLYGAAARAAGGGDAPAEATTAEEEVELLAAEP